jgi:hypothetical protein
MSAVARRRAETAIANGLVVTIAGDLSRAELVSPAGSLRTAG